MSAMNYDTIADTGPIGKRLDGMMRDDARTLVFGGTRVPLAGKLVIGRDSSCGVVIDNMLVSKKHALIQKIKDDYFVKDLESTNGTFVNGARVPEGKYVKLAPGDKIKIGKSVLTLS